MHCCFSFSADVYDADAVRKGRDDTFVTACFEHKSFIEIVLVNNNNPHSASIFQQIMIEKPKRVLMMDELTLLVGSYTNRGYLTVLTRSEHSKFVAINCVDTFSCCPKLDNIWGMGLTGDCVAILHKKRGKNSGKLALIKLNEIMTETMKNEDIE